MTADAPRRDDVGVVLLACSGDLHMEEILTSLAPASLVVVDLGSIEPLELPEPATPTTVRSVVSSLGGLDTADLDFTKNDVVRLLELVRLELGTVDGVVVAPAEGVERALTEPETLAALGQIGVGEIVLVESPDGGWERARTALECDGTAGVAVSAVRVRDATTEERSDRPVAALMSAGSFGRAMTESDYEDAVRTAADVRNDALAGARWEPDTLVLCEGWLVVSDDPEPEGSLFERVRDALLETHDLRPTEQAVLVRIDDDDWVGVDRLADGDHDIAVRAGLDRSGFFAPGKWVSLGHLTCGSGRLRIGHRRHTDDSYIAAVPPGSRWLVERYIASEYGWCIGMRVRHIPEEGHAT